MEIVNFPQLVGPTYSMVSLNADCQRCMNLQLEAIESGEGANKFYLRETPGLVLKYDLGTLLGGAFATASIQAFYASSYFSDLLYIVIDDYFVYLNTQSGAISSVYMFSPAKIGTNRFPMQIIENTEGVFVSPSMLGSGVTVDLLTIGLFSRRHDGASTTYFRVDAGVTSPTGYQGIGGLVFLNNRLIAVSNGSVGIVFYPATKFQISPIAANVNTAWSAAEVYGVEGNIDALVGLVVNGAELWCFSSNSYEVFTDVGGTNLHVFARIRDAVTAIGCMHSGSIQQIQSKVIWLSRSLQGSGIVYISNGLNAERISTAPIEELIAPYIRSNLDSSFISVFNLNCYSFTYTLDGHVTYVLTLLTSESTPTLLSISLAYDLTTGQWHELSYRDSITGEVSQHRGKYAANTGAIQLVADHTLPYLYELSTTTYTDNLAPIIRYRRSPVLLTNNRRIFFSRLILNMEVGVGLIPTATPANTDDPLISVRWSNDNAHTFGNYHTIGLGAIGKFFQQIVFNRLGSSLRRVFEVYFDAAVPFRIITAELGIDTGVH